MSEVIITAALNGPTTHRGQCRAVPYTPQEIGQAARRAFEAGAAVVHVHAREDGGGPSYRVERHREVIAAIKNQCPVLISMSTELLGASLDDRGAAVEADPDLLVIPVGAMTLGRVGPAGFETDRVFHNRFADTLHLQSKAAAQGIECVSLCRDLGHIASAERLAEMGSGGHGRLFEIALGHVGGAPADTHTAARLASVLPAGALWWASTSGAEGWPALMGALSLGAQLRVGLEDQLTLPNGDAADGTASLVAAAVAMVRALGDTPASVEAARAMLSLSAPG